MTNAKIADVLDQVADLLEFQAANPFRVRAYRKGARVIRDLAEPLATIVAEGQRDLTSLEGIGKDLAAKCVTLIETGKLPLLDELLADVPASALEMMRVPGLGPKKAAAVFQQLQVTDLASLRAACQAHQVQALKGFGAKTEEAILAGLDLAEAAAKRMLWADADQLAHELLAYLDDGPGIQKRALAGSYRRAKDTVGDLDLLVVSDDVQAVMDWWAELPTITSVIARGDTKMSVRLDHGFQVDLRIVPAESYGAALQYFTGSKDHNVVVRGRAKQRGLKINEYGVFDVDSGDRVAGETEQDVYAALQLPLFPPELREARQEFDWADEGELPRLIELSDIRGDLHMHTVATDGKATLVEMAQAAADRRLHYIAITDHSQRVSMARGLDAQRLLEQWAEIDQLNESARFDLRILKGIECDILESGGMDLPDDVLAQADWVLASVHYGQRQSRAQITQRILGAVENPYVSAIAHPTGRLLNKRDPYEVDIEQVFAAVKKHGKLLELNANPQRLDLNDTHCAAAKHHGIPIVINTDAHSVVGLDVMRFGINQAQRAGLTSNDVANTRSVESFLERI